MKQRTFLPTWGHICLIILLASVCQATASSDPAAELPPSPPVSAANSATAKSSPLKMVAPGIFEIGKCTIFKTQNRVEFPATINMQKGLLEYLIVGDAGKLHESLLMTDVEPYELQIALLLTGLEGSLNPLAGQGDQRLPDGDPVAINVRWQDNGQERSLPVAKWLLQNNEPVANIPWTFTGSMIIDGNFMAQSERSIVAVFHDPIAMIDHRLPEGSNDEIWFANPALVPPPGTEITVSIEKAIQ